MIDIITQYTEDIICPYCGHKHYRHSVDLDLLGDEMECHNCEEEFEIEMEVTVEFCTSKKEVKQ